MPLFELYSMAKEKLNSSREKNTSCSTDLSFIPGNEFVELVWENGQVMMRGQSNRPKKNHLGNGLPSFTLTSQSPERIDKDADNVGEASTSKKLGTEDPEQNEFPISVPSCDMGLRHDEDIVPWFSCPINESLQNEYCSDYLPELSGGAVNELSHLYHFNFVQKISCNQEVYNDYHANAFTDEVGLEHRNATLTPSIAFGANIMNSELSSLRPADNMGPSTSNLANNSSSGDSASLPRVAAGFPSKKVHAKGSSMSAKNSDFVNFSHFARPFAPSQPKAQSISVNATMGLPGIGKGVNGSSANNSNAANSNLLKTSASLMRETASCQTLAEQLMITSKPSEAEPVEEPRHSKHLEANCRNDASRNDTCANQSSCASTNKASPGNEKIIKPAAAASSVCSGNSMERASDGPTCNLKRKSCSTNDSEAPTEDVEEDSVGAMKAARARGTNSKRRRAAEVHNLSERRRRDRINEKMRALQELIPNCNKADKASMLDEAIEYLKTLQLQVQMMSMAAGSYMSPMMLPMGMQQMHPSQMARFSPMGIGMGLGMGMIGMNGGAAFPSTLMARATALPAMAASNFPVFGLPGQGHHMSIPCTSFIPFPGAHLSKPETVLNAFEMSGTAENMDTALTSSSKDLMQNTNGARCLTNHTSTECQARNSNFEQTILPKNMCLDMDIHADRIADSVNENDGALVRETCGS